MPEIKTITRRPASELFLLPRDGSTASLRLQLQKEIDKLALLIDEVKKQSDRVQAAADAIADKVLLETPRQVYSKNRRKGPSPEIRASSSFSDGSSPV